MINFFAKQPDTQDKQLGERGSEIKKTKRKGVCVRASEYASQRGGGMNK